MEQIHSESLRGYPRYERCARRSVLFSASDSFCNRCCEFELHSLLRVQKYLYQCLWEVFHGESLHRSLWTALLVGFVLINALKNDVVGRSIRELECHDTILNEMDLDRTAKIQIHVGGV